MNSRFPVLVSLAGVCLGLGAGCASSPTRGNSSDPMVSEATSTAARTGLGTTGAANSTGSAAGPGTSTGINRGGGR